MFELTNNYGTPVYLYIYELKEILGFSSSLKYTFSLSFFFIPV